MNAYSYLNMQGSTGFLFYILLILDLVLKGISLWKSAQKKQTVWFVALLLVNSLGILPIIYLLIEKNRSKAVVPAVKRTVTKKVSKRK